MTVENSALAQLQALRESYALELPNRLDAVERLWSRRHETEMLAALHLQLHSLAGSGATFGFAEVSRITRQMELVVKAVLAGELRLDEERARVMQQYFVRLREAATRRDETSPELPAAQPLRKARDRQEVLLLQQQDAAGEELASQLSDFGYDCLPVADETALRNVAHVASPLAAIVDSSLYTSTSPLLDAAGKTVPLLFLSSRDDFAERLRGVRSGGRGYFIKPADALALTDMLDELTTRVPRQPYRVLIVEDTRELAEYYAFILDSGGMHTLVVNDPMSVMGALHNFQPDLMLVDLYMPHCNGFELAAVIRQQQVFVGVPIVFLSGETDSDKQLMAMSHGADDFLNKSISPGFLAKSVAARIARSRNVRSLMVRDSLTGLYNHTSTKEQLERELARARRQQSPLAFAMLDIDKFKAVNDNYGHPAGDRVIKSLARYLKQRLRASDVIGRYGGEEFAVILPDTTAAAAMQVLNEIRAGFGRLRHHTARGDIGVSFSCGIAEYPRYGSAHELNDAADKALYKAKQAGRDQVLVAG